YGGATSLYASQRSCFVPRLISITSRKCRGVTIAAGGRFRVISAFVATVVPWEKTTTSRRSIPASVTPSTTASIGSAVEGTLRTSMLPSPSSRMQMSVNVPPTSTATRRFGMERSLTGCRLRIDGLPRHHALASVRGHGDRPPRGVRHHPGRGRLALRRGRPPLPRRLGEPLVLQRRPRADGDRRCGRRADEGAR